MSAGLNRMEKVFKIFYNKSGHVDPVEVQLAASLLGNHGVVALPTDTLYGLAARADSNEALQRIYKIKGRDADKPLAVCVAEIDQISQIAEISNHNKKVIPHLLPGPFTIVLKRSSALNKDLNPNIDNVGVRVPDHNFIRSVCRELNCPLALTSANKSGDISPTLVDDFKSIWDELDAVFDVGPTRDFHPALKDSDISIKRLSGSTVIDLTEDKAYKILREGCSLYRTQNLLHRFGFKNKSKK